jgi:hypothetical protein
MKMARTNGGTAMAGALGRAWQLDENAPKRASAAAGRRGM